MTLVTSQQTLTSNLSYLHYEIQFSCRSIFYITLVNANFVKFPKNFKKKYIYI